MENKYTNPDSSKSSFNYRTEEASLYGGCRRYSDGIYRSLPRPGQYTLADGLRLLAVHSMADSADCAEVYLFMTGGPDTEQRELFFLTDHEKEALPCSRPLTRQMMHPICTAVLHSFPQYTAQGRTLCIDCWEPSAHNPRTLHLRWEGADAGYTVIDDPMDAAETEHDLATDVTLSSNDSHTGGNDSHTEGNDSPGGDNPTPVGGNDTAAVDITGVRKTVHHAAAAALIHCPQDIAGNHTYTRTCHCPYPVCDRAARRTSRSLCRIRPGPVGQCILSIVCPH